MSDLGELRDRLESFLKNTRWWPRNYTDFEIAESYETEHGILLILSSNKSLFQLPLTPVEQVPEELVHEGRYLEFNGKTWVESEFTTKYLDLLNAIPVVKRLEYKSFRGRVVEASPLDLGTTNIVAKQRLDNGLEFVVKSYRLLPVNNPEPRILEKLHSKGFRNIPRLYYSYVLEKGKHIHLSFIMEYVRGVGDGGKPFYDNFRKYLEVSRGKDRALLNSLCLGRLARKLGWIIADMHVKLNLDSRGGFFGLEEIRRSDVKSWVRRVRNRYKYILERLDELISDSSGKAKNRYEYWRTVLNREVEKKIEYFEEDLEKHYLGSYKGRIHQDLHLQQMIYVPEIDSFIITDFEGEPGREEKERVVKEPLVRDLASMVTSFHYLSFAAYHDVHRHRDPHTTAHKLYKQKIPVTWIWAMKHSVEMILAYAVATRRERVGRDLFGFKKHSLINHYHVLLPPWIFERAIYEISYELSYRPKWFVIPLLGIIHMPIPYTRVEEKQGQGVPS